MLELKNIYFERDNKIILNNINLKLDNNKTYIITGPNGGGKSTLAKIIMGIEKPDSGKIIFDGQDITDMDISKRANLGISFAFQHPVRFKGITVEKLIKLAMKNDEEKKDICTYLSKVGLCPKEYIKREVNSSLSGGELKRIEIATILAKKAKLTIFDEPEAGIDLWSFNNLIDIFENLKNEITGIQIIISHQERILNIADEIILISNGKIKKQGDRKEVLPELLNNTKNCRFIK